MKKTKKSELEWIQYLLDITYQIKKIYDQLVTFVIDEKDDEYQKYLEYLALYLEEENKIYQKLDVKLENNDRVFGIIEILNSQSDKDGRSKQLIIGRIVNYLITRRYINPFLSMNQDYQEEENALSIFFQYDRDYLLHVIDKLDEKILGRNMRGDLLRIKYETIMMFKPLEREILFSKNTSFHFISGRERAILFGQNEQYVHELYLRKASLIVQSNISYILNMSLFDVATIKSKQLFYQKQFISLESAISLLDEEEVNTIYVDIVGPYISKLNFIGDKRLEEINHIFEDRGYQVDLYKKGRIC